MAQMKLSDAETQAVKQRYFMIAQQEHVLNALKAELEMMLKKNHPEMRDSINLDVNIEEGIVGYD